MNIIVMFPPYMSLSVRDAEQHEKVEKYVKTFSSWIPYEHRVLGEVKDVNGTARIVPIPPNIGEEKGGQGRQWNSQDCPHSNKYR